MASFQNFLSGMSPYQQQALAAQLAAYQKAAYTQQTASSIANVGQTTSTTSTTFNFYTTTNAITAGGQQAEWSPDNPDSAFAAMAEEVLQRKLTRDRQMLLKWQRMALMPKLNFAHGAMAESLDIREVEGYLLPADRHYVLPDGSTLSIDPHGNYGINDESAKVIYQACRRREFNPYLNASDLLVAFVKEVGTIDGVNQDEILRLPIEAFINWIVLQAATKDGDATDHLPKVEDALKSKNVALGLQKVA